jgi:hypothetical protein
MRPELIAAAALCGFAGSGCNGLTYDRQEKVFVFHKGRPEVKVLLVYEGLRVLGDHADSLARAKEQLAELFVNRQEFWFGDGQTPLHFSLRKPAPGEDGKLQPLLQKHVTVEQVEFFFSPGGRLCAIQKLTFREPEALLEGLNEIISELVAEKVQEESAKSAADGSSDLDPESLRLLAAASQKKFRWLRMEPGRFSLTMPASPVFCNKIKAELLHLRSLADTEGVLDRGSGKAGEAKAAARDVARVRAGLQEISSGPWSFDQRAKEFTIALGYGDGEPIRVSPGRLASPPATRWDTELITFARRLEVPFADKREIETLVAQFLKSASTE